jgi:hypothetical protein
MFLIQVWVYEFLPVELHLLMIAAALAWRETLIPPQPIPVATAEKPTLSRPSVEVPARGRPR